VEVEKAEKDFQGLQKKEDWGRPKLNVDMEISGILIIQRHQMFLLVVVVKTSKK
jgi:hypothetical protein